MKVETLNPDTTFFANKKDLVDPFSFRRVMVEKTTGKPSGPLFGTGGLFAPQTKGQMRDMFKRFLEGE